MLSCAVSRLHFVIFNFAETERGNLTMTEAKAETQSVDKLRLMTWNMNGVRSFDDFQDRITNCEADIICIQETKVILILIYPTFPGHYPLSR